MSRARFSVEWTDEAKADLTAIVDYIADGAPANALAVLDRLEALGNSLEHLPTRCRRVPEAVKWGERNYREALLPPYRLIFKLDGARVLLLAVVDGRRDLRDELFYRLRVRG